VPDEYRPAAAPSGGSAYRIVPYAPQYRMQVAVLQTHLWGNDVAGNLRYWEWKHERNPYLDAPLAYLAFHGDQLVGMRAMFGAMWQVDGHQFLVPCAGDLVVAPDHRDKGLFTRIMGAALEDLDRRGIPFLFNLSAGPTTFVGSLAMGWRMTESVDPVTWAGPSGIRRLAAAVVQRVTGSPPALLDLRSRYRRAAPPVSVTREPRPERMAELVARLGTTGRIRHVRDEAYFAWRYRNPRGRYRYLFCEAEGLSGYLVLGWRRQQAGAEIIDWEFEDPVLGAALLDAAINWGDLPALATWAVSLPASARELLERRGFVGASGARSLIDRTRKSVLVRRVGSGAGDGRWVLGGRELLDIHNWDLRLIYSDGR